MSIPASVRPLRAAGRAAAAALLQAEWPFRAEDAARLRAGRVDHDDTRRWAILDDESSVIGYAAIWRVQGDRFRMDLVVAPAWRRQGIGGRVLELVAAAAADRGAATVQARATAAEAVAFLHRRGFVETMRMVGQRLELASIDAERLWAYIRRAEDSGFALTTLAAAEPRDAQCWPKLWRLYQAVQEGWADPDPRPEPEEPISWEAFLRRRDELSVDPEAFFILRSGERHVGFTGALGTGVDPAFRRRGLAHALKAAAVLRAQAAGVVAMETSTGNAAMARANENVGYRRTYEEVRLVRRIGGSR